MKRYTTWTKLFLSLLIIVLQFEAFSQITISQKSHISAAIGYDNGSGYNSNYGNAPQCAGYDVPGWQGGYNVNRGLINFDLSSIPVGTNIVSAKMDLYAFGPVSSYPGHYGTANSCYLERVTDVWDEYGVTWNSQPSTTSVSQVTLPQSIDPLQDYIDIDVTSLVQDMVNDPTNSFGFMLRMVNEVSPNVLIFASNNYSDASKYPSLEIVMGCEATGVDNHGFTQQAEYLNVYPNPASDQVILNFGLNTHSEIFIEVLDLMGRSIIAKDLGAMSIGAHAASLNLKGLTIQDGLYYVVIKTRETTLAKNFIKVGQD